MNRKEGTVLFWKGTWGIIVPTDGSDDHFVHYTKIEGDGYKTLNQGERVTFESGRGEDGLAAFAVRREGRRAVDRPTLSGRVWSNRL